MIIVLFILLLILCICPWCGPTADWSDPILAPIHILFDNAAFSYIYAFEWVTLSADGYCCTPVYLVAPLAGREVAFAAVGLDRYVSARAYLATRMKGCDFR
jgi:hypothetical protein